MSRPEDTLSFGASSQGAEMFAQISVQLTSSILMEETLKWAAKKMAGETATKVAVKKLTGTLVKSMSSKAQYKLGQEATKELAKSCGKNIAKLQSKMATLIAKEPGMTSEVAKGFKAMKGIIDDAAKNIKDQQSIADAIEAEEDIRKAKKLKELKELEELEELKKLKELDNVAKSGDDVLKGAKYADDLAKAAKEARLATRAAIQIAKAAAASVRLAKGAATIVANMALKMGASCAAGPVGCAVGVVMLVFDMLNLALDQIDPSGISIFITKDDIDTIAKITQEAKAQSLIDENTPLDLAYGWFDTEVTFDPTAFFFDPVPDPVTGEFLINEEYFKMFDSYRDEYMKSIGVTPHWREYIETVELPSSNNPLVISAASLILKEVTELQVQDSKTLSSFVPNVVVPKSNSNSTTLIILVIVIIFIFILMFMFIK